MKQYKKSFWAKLWPEVSTNYRHETVSQRDKTGNSLKSHVGTVEDSINKGETSRKAATDLMVSV
jgi:hypothetical protein